MWKACTSALVCAQARADLLGGFGGEGGPNATGQALGAFDQRAGLAGAGRRDEVAAIGVDGRELARV